MIVLVIAISIIVVCVVPLIGEVRRPGDGHDQTARMASGTLSRTRELSGA
jgi:hypothetical protein